MKPNIQSWIDVSLPLREGMVQWPGDGQFKVDWSLSMDQGKVCNLTSFSTSTHTGTHMDAPLHFVHKGQGIDLMPLSLMVGQARVIEVLGKLSVEPDDLSTLGIGQGETIFIKTDNSALWETRQEFPSEYAHLSKEAAEVLVEAGVGMVGIDFFSIGRYGGEGIKTHKTLLGAGIWVLEALDLSKVSPGMYEYVCLPLKLIGLEGSPCRAIVRPIDKDGTGTA